MSLKRYLSGFLLVILLAAPWLTAGPLPIGTQDANAAASSFRPAPVFAGWRTGRDSGAAGGALHLPRRDLSAVR